MATISIKLTQNLTIDLDIEERLTFIGGDSGTGKTLFIKALQDLTKNPDLAEIQGVPIEKFVICLEERDVPSIMDKKQKIIVLDRYDIYSLETKKKIWKKMSELDNTWIIMTRKPSIKANYGHSSKSYKHLKKLKSNNKIKLYLEQH